ncbi:hypothetical protein CHS0354_043186 [Potamilus streckersoni]|uniref:Translin n=1 Tax=Potamilus streckersoni TaxID=2493646 RepID=A0AAE0SNB0_9BIVA|nr:hypothetical protein CHS0354_043186 [Potamilus streckersoni]
MATEGVKEIFQDFQVYLENEQKLREDIRQAVLNIEQSAREIMTLLLSVHQQDGIKQTPSICETVSLMFHIIQEKMRSLAELVPANQYYRFNDIWRFVIQRLVFLAAFLTYLQSETLVSRNTVATLIGVKVNREDGFHLDLDDYLQGLLQLASELCFFSGISKCSSKITVLEIRDLNCTEILNKIGMDYCDPAK